jgi:CMP/dCMP kinase
MAEQGRAGGPASRLVIAIDGPVGSGKSTVAKRLAAALGSLYIDSGAMYRAVGWKAVQMGLDITDHDALAGLAARTDIRVVPSTDGPRMLVDGRDVTGELRTPTMDEAASVVSTCPAVRARLVELQRAIAAERGVVMDGRDIGTVVFPAADVKFFLDADLTVRAERRLRDLDRAGTRTDRAAVEQEILRRDARDQGRAVAPLRPAADAVRLDTTPLDVEGVVAELLRVVAERCRIAKA